MVTTIRAAISVVMLAGFYLLAVGIIGALAGSGSEHLGTALLLFPVASLAMIGVNFAVRRLQPVPEIPIRTPLQPPL